jgi:hypothetical protein
MTLVFSELSAVLYEADNVPVYLTPEQQSLAVQAVAFFSQTQTWTDYDQYSDDIDALVAGTLDALEKRNPVARIIASNTFTHFHCNSIADFGASLVIAFSTSQAFGFTNRAVPAAQYDAFTFEMFAEAGLYDIEMWYVAQSNNGIGQFYFGNETHPDIDLYSASILFNQSHTFSGVEVDASGYMSCGCMTQGKRAASTGYVLPITCFHFRKVG